MDAAQIVAFLVLESTTTNVQCHATIMEFAALVLVLKRISLILACPLPVMAMVVLVRNR